MIRWVFALATFALPACAIEYRVPAADSGGSEDGDDDDADCSAPTESCGGACVDTLSDPDNCGECGRACAASEVCDAGECAASCSGGRSECTRSCVDLQTDALHCGDCTEQCEPGGSCVAADCIDSCNDSCVRDREICASGTCECRSGFTSCNGACVDLATDPQHCGACDRDCGGDPCGASDCRPSGCGDFPDQCSSSCTDVTSDPLHCGRCDDPCDGDEVCVDGDCDDPE